MPKLVAILIAAAFVATPAAKAASLTACQAEATALATGAERIELRPPGRTDFILLRMPVKLPDGGGRCGSLGWRQIGILRPGAKQPVIVAGYDPADRDTLHMMESDPRVAWSPDGRILVLWRIANAGKGPQTVEFLDVARGEWTTFLTRDERISATTDTFMGWRAGAPHVALVADVTRAAKSPVPAYAVDE